MPPTKGLVPPGARRLRDMVNRPIPRFDELRSLIAGRPGVLNNLTLSIFRGERGGSRKQGKRSSPSQSSRQMFSDVGAMHGELSGARSTRKQGPGNFNMPGSSRMSFSGLSSNRSRTPGLFGRTAFSSGLGGGSQYSFLDAQRRVQDRLSLQQFTGETNFGDASGLSFEGLNFPSGNASSQRGMQGTLKYRSMVQRASRETGVPEALILAVMGLESGGDPSAGSVAGAQGLMQVMPFHSKTAQQVAGSTNLKDPWVSIRTGAEILKNYEKQWGGWQNAVKAYLAGSPHSTARDAYGTGVNDYVTIVANNLAWLRQQGIGQSSQQGFSGGSFSGAASAQLNQAINVAQQFAGQPYVWGGASPSTGFDCSGLMQWAYGQAGIRLPRTAGEQFDNTQRISASQARPGDLVFFHSTYNNPHHWITHVGIYLGNGKMFHSGSGGVGVVSLNTDYFQSRLAGYGRVRG